MKETSPWVALLNGTCTLRGAVSAAQAKMIFKPLPGTTGTLVPLHAPGNLDFNTIDPQAVTLHEDRGDISIFGPIYDPQEFIFTTLDGRQFQFNEWRVQTT